MLVLLSNAFAKDAAPSAPMQFNRSFMDVMLGGLHLRLPLVATESGHLVLPIDNWDPRTAAQASETSSVVYFNDDRLPDMLSRLRDRKADHCWHKHGSVAIFICTGSR